uniref:Uncharacterized protein n=1 Tax=Lactuca sativa TaxID=4236 RepID=A0A9R1XW93_LACSA|nr:hypothetical protein LSAT_V11C200052340 [Lactuca sativa]
MDLYDIFGQSLNLEDTHLNEGFQKDYDIVFASGKDDGREAGLKTGFINGLELRFYRGCICDNPKLFRRRNSFRPTIHLCLRPWNILGP